MSNIVVLGGALLFWVVVVPAALAAMFVPSVAEEASELLWRRAAVQYAKAKVAKHVWRESGFESRAEDQGRFLANQALQFEERREENRQTQEEIMKFLGRTDIIENLNVPLEVNPNLMPDWSGVMEEEVQDATT